MNDDAPCAEQLDAELRADLEVQQKQNKELTAERDAALARNAELEAEVRRLNELRRHEADERMELEESVRNNQRLANQHALHANRAEAELESALTEAEEWSAMAAHPDNFQINRCTNCAAVRAELDNLRDRVTKAKGMLSMYYDADVPHETIELIQDLRVLLETPALVRGSDDE